MPSPAADQPNDPSAAATSGVHIAGSADTGGGDVVGRDKLVIGAGAQVTMQFYPITLRAPLREAFDILIDNRTALFGGRSAILSRVATYLEQPDGGYLMLTAPVGFGKTALAATIVRGNEAAFAYHFFSPLLNDSLTELFFLRNVVEQMAQWHGYAEPLPGGLADLRALYHHFIDQPRDRTRVLVLDGLDEVTAWPLAPYLGRSLPPGLKFILTIRDVGQDFVADYRLPRAQVTHLRMEGMARTDLVDTLRSGGPSTAPLADDPSVVDAIGRVSAYELDPTLGADPLYVRLLVEDLRSGALTPATLAQQPSGLERYLDLWWKAIKKLAGDGPTRDLFGTLAVALGPLRQQDLEAINPSLVDDWAADFFEDVLERVRRFVAGDQRTGYVLAHPRLRQYMRRQIKVESYERRLLDFCASWATTGSTYPLRFWVQHLRALATPGDIYGVVLDPTFRGAQLQLRGGLPLVLADLRTALGVALEHDDVVGVLRCAGAYREVGASPRITAAIFDAVDAAEWRSSFERAELHGTVSDWTRLLWCYLAWEATVGGSAEMATTAALRAQRYPASDTGVAAETLLVRTAELLAATPGAGRSADDWLRQIVPARAPDALRARATPPPEPDEEREAELLGEMDRPLDYYTAMAMPQQSDNLTLTVLGSATTRWANDGDDAESAAFHAERLRRVLRELALVPAGRAYIESALATVRANPYTAYRDIALLALADAATALADPDALRTTLRAILEVALEREGVRFTFDLAAVLAGEARRRALPAADLDEYLQRASANSDRWSTAMRVLSAEAAALHWTAQPVEAVAALQRASTAPGGFAGITAVTLLTLANRCLEFGRAEMVEQPIWGPSFATPLLPAAHSLAANVRDVAFRARRVALVERYLDWLRAPLPDIATTLAALSTDPDEDQRNAYAEHVAARWAAQPDAETWRGLKALVPLVLASATTLDAVLARLTALRMAGWSDAELQTAVEVCATQLATARPWQQLAPRYA